MRHGICSLVFCIGDPVKRREPLPQWFGLQVKMPSLMCSWKFDSFGQRKFYCLFFYLFDKTKAGRKILMKRLWLNQLIKHVSLKLGITINSSYPFSSTVSSPTQPSTQPPNQAPNHPTKPQWENFPICTPGMFFQNGLTGEAWGDWALYTDSPLRALSPAQEVIAGTGGPFGDDFWDPAGITSKKSKEEIFWGAEESTGTNGFNLGEGAEMVYFEMRCRCFF